MFWGRRDHQRTLVIRSGAITLNSLQFSEGLTPAAGCKTSRKERKNCQGCTNTLELGSRKVHTKKSQKFSENPLNGQVSLKHLPTGLAKLQFLSGFSCVSPGTLAGRPLFVPPSPVCFQGFPCFFRVSLAFSGSPLLFQGKKVRVGGSGIVGACAMTTK